MRLLLLLAVLVPMMAPPAAAQGLGVVNAVVPIGATSVEVLAVPPSEPIPVDQVYVALPVQVVYRYSPTVPTFAPTKMHLSVADAPPWLTATVTPNTLSMPIAGVGACPCYTYESTATAFLLVGATHDAPAFAQGLVRLIAEAEQNGVYMSSYADLTLPIVPAFQALTDVRAAANHVALQPGEERAAPLTITNHGNAAIRVAFEVLEAPQGVRVTPPDALIVGSRQQGDERNTAATILALRADGSLREGDVVLLARSTYALDPKLPGDAVKVTIHVARASGGGDVMTQSLGLSSGDALALQMGLAVAGLAGTVLWARHRKLR
ncbi:MAG TPA: hypothetical protein VGR28_01220 [Candidatus Thermoplasmatota archaeon]|nr:hypothetical protein [Candidatus Thermoplasmatota archaeon]